MDGPYAVTSTPVGARHGEHPPGTWPAAGHSGAGGLRAAHVRPLRCQPVCLDQTSLQYRTVTRYSLRRDPCRRPSPIAGMRLTPCLYAGDVDRAFEDIAVLGFIKPAPLTGRFTGGAAGLFPAILLAFGIPWVGDEKMLAMPALTPCSSCHDSASRGPESKRTRTTKETVAR